MTRRTRSRGRPSQRRSRRSPSRSGQGPTASKLTIASPSSVPSCHRTCWREMPYTDPWDPDFIELYRYSDLDALLELFGHLRATNPTSPCRASGLRISLRLMTTRDIWSCWAEWTGMMRRVRSSTDCNSLSSRSAGWMRHEPGDAYFEVTDGDGRSTIHRPRLDESHGRKILREDVALFARAVSPFNRKRFVTICNGMYGRGTYGAVRALTDERFRDRNARISSGNLRRQRCVLHT